MNYESHMDELCKKLSKRIGLLKHISPFLNQRQRETYCNGVLKLTLLYGSMIWDSCSINFEHLQSILLEIRKSQDLAKNFGGTASKAGKKICQPKIVSYI